jgi:hypothetical protein
MMKRLGWASFQHHILNLIVGAPTQLLSLLVTVMLSARANAWFYIALMMSNFVFSLSISLTTVLHATNAAQYSMLKSKARLTVGLSLLASVIMGGILVLGAQPILRFFGPDYATHSVESMRILVLAAIPLTIKNHYLAFCRIKDQVRQAIIPVTVGAALELAIAALGAKMGGLTGLSLGWVGATVLESLIMMPVVWNTLMGKSGQSAFDRYLDEIVSAETMFLPALNDFTPSGAIYITSTGLSTVLTEMDTLRVPVVSLKNMRNMNENIDKDQPTALPKRNQFMSSPGAFRGMSSPGSLSEPSSPGNMRGMSLPGKMRETSSPGSLHGEISSSHFLNSAKSNANAEQLGFDYPSSGANGHGEQVAFPSLNTNTNGYGEQVAFPSLSPNTNGRGEQVAFPSLWPDVNATQQPSLPANGPGPAKWSTTDKSINVPRSLGPKRFKPVSAEPRMSEPVQVEQKAFGAIEAHETLMMATPKVEQKVAKIEEHETLLMATPQVAKIEEYKTLEMATPRIENLPTAIIAKPPLKSQRKLLPLEEPEMAEEEKKNSLIMNVVLFLLPIVSFCMWFFSLQGINVRLTNNLGLISVFPPTLIAALAIISISFCLTLRQPKVRYPHLILHFALLIFMLYGVSNLIEEMPRFAIVYRHAGYTEFIMRTGTSDPNLDAYFSWPGFFSLSAFLTKIAGYTDILPYAQWAPVYYNVFYFGPLYLFFTSFTNNRRVAWLGLWLFYLTNWIGQDYYSPQGLNFFLYMTVIVILVRWFKADPETKVRPLGPRLRKLPFAVPFYDWLRSPDPLLAPSNKNQRIALLACFIIVFAFIVFSHQLTPFFVIFSIGALIIARRTRHWWLLPLTIIMTAAWVLIMARVFLAGHQSMVFSGLNLLSSFTENVSSRVAGDPQHTFIARIRIVMSMVIWGSAFIAGVIRYRKGYRDVTVVLLALTPFPLFIVQPYGGEMLLRSYLFSLPSMLFLISSFFYSVKFMRKGYVRVAIHIALCMVLLGGFLYTRYGNESMDYMTKGEVDGVRAMYNMAPDKSLFLAPWMGLPWQYKDYEKYTTTAFSDDPNMIDDIRTMNIPAVTTYIMSQHATKTYIIFTRSEFQTFGATSGMPTSTLKTFEQKIMKSGKFNLVYQNPDAQVFQFMGGK